jgi:hypothetical protein
VGEGADIVSIVTQRARERVLYRLRNPVVINGVCGFYHPDDKAALERLAGEDLATCWLGEGKDAGLLLGTLKLPRALAIAAPAAQPEGVA